MAEPQKKNWWGGMEDWYKKYFEGGPFGSALWSPYRALSTPVGKGSTQRGEVEEQPWEAYQRVRELQTPEGVIPFEGNEYLKDWLSSQGWKLNETDERGWPLPPNQQYFSPPTAQPSEEPGMDLMALSPWEQAQIENWQRSSNLQERQFAFQQQQTMADTSMQPQESYEDYRKRLMSELSAPSDWISRWQLGQAGQMPPMLQRETGRMTGEIEQTQGLIDQKIKAAREAYISGDYKRGSSLTRTIKELSEDLAGLQEDYFPYIEKQRENAAAVMAYNQGNIEGSGKAPPTTPAAPAWLPQFVSSQVAGQPISKAQVRTPSWQQWEQTPWSVREGLKGYSDWSGMKPWTETLEHMQMMEPTGPKYTRKGGWASNIQR